MKRVKEQPRHKAVDGDRRREKNTSEWEKIVDKQSEKQRVTKKKKAEKEGGRKMSRKEDKHQPGNARAYVISLILLAFRLSPDR